MSISYQSFIHPEDAAARRQLEAVPGFNEVVKLYLKLGLEKLLHGLFMAQKIRLSPTQLPEIYNLLPPVCKKFGIKEPEFYLEMNPIPNAYTTGDDVTFLVVTSGLLEHLTREEQQAVVAHECGHILCRHVFYQTLAYALVNFADSFGILGKFITPVQLALNYWSRRCELSADRAEVVYMGTSKPAIQALIRLVGGPRNITEYVNVEEYAMQSQAYLELQENSSWHKLLQNMAVMNNSHPFSAIRVNELLKWENSEQFQQLHNALEKQELNPLKTCNSCGLGIAVDCKYCRFCGAKQ